MSFTLVLASVGIILWVATLLIHLIALYQSVFYLYSWRKQRSITVLSKTNAVGVSIIKTLTTSSPNVLLNLESVFKLTYPKFELLICVQEKGSDIIPHVKELMKKYPLVDAQLFSGASSAGVNPKVNNMLQCYDHIKYEYAWICDSNIFVHEWSLNELASHIQPNVGMIHQVPYMLSGNLKGISHCLEKVYFGTHHARWYIAFAFLKQSCVNGMSSIFNKALLDEVGGLAAFSNYIAEDHFMGLSFHTRNLKVVLSTEPALQNPDICSVINFTQRITRWLKLRLTMLPTGYVEPLIECFLIGIIGSISMGCVFQTSFLDVFIKHILFWFICDQILLWKIQGDYSHLPPFWQRIITWLFREFLTYWVFVQAVLNRKINWQMGTFDLKFGGKAKLVLNNDVKHS